VLHPWSSRYLQSAAWNDSAVVIEMFYLGVFLIGFGEELVEGFAVDDVWEG